MNESHLDLRKNLFGKKRGGGEAVYITFIINTKLYIQNSGANVAIGN